MFGNYGKGFEAGISDTVSKFGPETGYHKWVIKGIANATKVYDNGSELNNDGFWNIIVTLKHADSEFEQHAYLGSPKVWDDEKGAFVGDVLPGIIERVDEPETHDEITKMLDKSVGNWRKLVSAAGLNMEDDASYTFAALEGKEIGAGWLGNLNPPAEWRKKANKKQKQKTYGQLVRDYNVYAFITLEQLAAAVAAGTLPHEYRAQTWSTTTSAATGGTSGGSSRSGSDDSSSAAEDEYGF
jgi:hypothetical protein